MFNDKFFTGGGSANSWMNQQYSLREKRQEEEEKRRVQEDLAASLSRSQERKGFLESALDMGVGAATATGGFVGDVVKGTFDSAVDRVEDFGVAAAEVTREFTGQNQADYEHNAKIAEEYAEMAGSFRQRARKETDPARRAEFERQANLLQVKIDSVLKQNVRDTERGMEATDPRKTLTNAAETALDAATGGLGGNLVRQGARRTVQNTFGKDMVRNTGAGVGLGAAYGGIDTARDENATLGDYATNIGVSSAAGGLLGGGATALVHGVARRIGDSAQTTTDDSGQLLLGPGQMRTLEENTTDLDRLNRNEFTDADDVWKETKVDLDGETVDINALDREIYENQRKIRDLEQQASGIDNNTGMATVPQGPTGDTYIRKSELSSTDARRSPEVTPEEFEAHRAAGKKKMEELDRTSSKPEALTDRASWKKISDIAYDKAQAEWDGITVNAKTGELVEQGQDVYSLSMRNPGNESVTLAPGASKAEFQKAMNEAKKRFRKELSRDGAHLGVFNNLDTGKIEIDPVLITSKLEDVHNVGAYTKSTGGAYHFGTGLGYWPPHIADDVNPAEFTGDVAGRGRAQEAVEELAKRNEELVSKREKAATMSGGISKELDTDKVKALNKQLKEERNGLLQSRAGEVTEDPTQRLQAMDEGTFDDDLYDPPMPNDSPEKIVADLERLDPNDESKIREHLEAAAYSRRVLEQKIDESGLMTDEMYEKKLAGLNQMFRDKENVAMAQPSPSLRKEMMDEVDVSYREQRNLIEEQYKSDGARLSKYEEALESIDAVEDSIFDRAIALRDEMWQTNKGAPNAERAAARRAELQQQKEIWDYAQKARRNENYAKAKDADPIESEAILKDAQQADVDIKTSDDPAIQKAVDDQAMASVHANSGKNPGILDTFAGMPPRVIEKFGTAGKQISKRIRKAIDDVTRENGKYEIRMQGWSERIGGNKDRVKMAKALDGDEEALKSLNKDQQAVHKEIREWFDDWADKLGLPHERRIKDYFPHVMGGKDMDSVNRALAYLKAGKKDGKDLTPKELKKYTDVVSGIDMETLKYISRANVYKVKKNGFLKKRTGAMDYEYDLFGALDLYNRRGNDTLIMGPAFDEVNQLSKAFSGEQNAYLDKVIRRLKGENADWENQLNNTLKRIPVLSKNDRAYNEASRSVRSLIYDATLGANPRSAIQNFEQGSMVFAELGTKNMVQGTGSALRAMRKGTQELRELYEEGVLEFTREGHLKGTSSELFKNKKEKVLWTMFRRTERWNRAVAYFGGKQKYIAKNKHLLKSGKMSEDEFARASREAGRALARKTNFEFSAFDVPLAMQSDMAKNAMQLQTYNVQKASELKQWIYGAEGLIKKNPDGSHSLSGEAAARMARFIGANALWYSTIGAGIGATYEMAVPFLAEFTDGEVPRSPMVQLLFGDRKANPGVLGLAGNAAGTIASGGDAGDVLDDAMALGRGAFRTLLPGGNQLLKTGEGIQSVERGASTTASGNLRFYQDTDVPGVLKALVLGQYATDAGKDWVKDGMPYVDKEKKLPGSHDTGLLEYMNTLPSEKQEQYYQYFTVKGKLNEQLGMAGSTKRTQLVKELKDGSISVATAHREAEEWNSRVIDYYQQNYGQESMPPRLVQDLMDSMIIDITSVQDATERGPSMSALEREQYYFNADTEW